MLWVITVSGHMRLNCRHWCLIMPEGDLIVCSACLTSSSLYSQIRPLFVNCAVRRLAKIWQALNRLFILWKLRRTDFPPWRLRRFLICVIFLWSRLLSACLSELANFSYSAVSERVHALAGRRQIPLHCFILPTTDFSAVMTPSVLAVNVTGQIMYKVSVLHHSLVWVQLLSVTF